MDNKLALVVQFASIDNLSGALRNIVGLGRSGKEALRGLQGEANRLKREMADVGRAIEGGSGNVTSLINRQRALASQIEKTNRQIQQQKNLLAIDAQAEAIRSRGADLQQRGQENVIAGATLAAPIILAVREAGQFSSALEDIRQRTGPAAAGTADLQRNIMALGRETRQLPTDITRTLDVLTGKGMDLRTSLTLAEPIARMGTALKVDLADGAETAYAAIQNLRVEASQTERVLGIFAQAGQLGAFEVKSMARYLPALTGRMSLFGESGERAAASLGAVLQVSRRMAGNDEEAANNIANLMDTLNSPEVIERFAKRAGVDLPRALQRLRNQGYDTYEAIAMLTQQATGGDAEKIGQLFGDRQARMGLLSIMQNLEDYRRIRQQSLDGGNTAIAKAFDSRVVNDASVNFRAFQTSLQALAITVGSSLLPQITPLIDKVTGAIDAFGRWADANPRAASAIMSTLGALLALRIGLGVVQYAVGGLFGPFATLFRWFGRAKELGLFARSFSLFARVATSGIAIAVRAFGLLRIAAMFLARGLMQAGLMMLANPIILAITAIVLVIAGAGYLIWRHWDTIKAAFMAGLDYLTQAWTWIKGLIVRFPLAFGPLGLVARFVITHWEQVKGAFSSAIDFIGALIPRFLAIGREIVNGLVAGITGNPGRVWQALKNIVTMGIDNVKWMLGIRSPSRVFMAIGGHVTDGLALGVDRGGKRPMASLAKLATGMVGGFALGTSLPAAAAGARGPASTAANSPAPVTINIYAREGQSARDIANEVADILGRRAQVNARGSYEDR